MPTIDQAHAVHDRPAHEVNPRSGQRVDDAPAASLSRRARSVCSACLRRPAVTLVHGRHVVLGDHDLCRQCWRALMDRQHATRLARRAAGGRSR